MIDNRHERETVSIRMCVVIAWYQLYGIPTYLHSSIAGSSILTGTKIDPKSGTGTYRCDVWESDKTKVDPNSVTLTVEVYTLSVSRK